MLLTRRGSITCGFLPRARRTVRSSFVSADGLIFTNHHIAQGCIHDLSTNGKDYMKNGFYAPTRAEEPKCPDVEFEVLEGMEDVTDKVNAAVKPGMSRADAGKAQRDEMSGSKRSARGHRLRCDVVTLYSGAMYHLYKYKKYDDVRLVFAPEFDIAFFGGDPDNFEYPRYDLDISFFRVYENDQPAKTNHYLKWSRRASRTAIWSSSPGIPAARGGSLPWTNFSSCATCSIPGSSSRWPAALTVLQKFSAQSAENARDAEKRPF